MKLLTNITIAEITQKNPNPEAAAIEIIAQAQGRLDKSVNDIQARIQIALKHLSAGQQVAAALCLQDLFEDLCEKAHSFPGTRVG